MWTLLGNGLMRCSLWWMETAVYWFEAYPPWSLAWYWGEVTYVVADLFYEWAMWAWGEA